MTSRKSPNVQVIFARFLSASAWGLKQGRLLCIRISMIRFQIFLNTSCAMSCHFQKIVLFLLLSFVPNLVGAAEKMVFRWDRTDKLAFEGGTLEFSVSVSFWEGDTKIYECYGFYYQKHTPTMSFTFPAGSDELLNAIIGIKVLKDGGVVEKDKEFRISRTGTEVTIAITPPYGGPDKPDKPELISIGLVDAVNFSNKVAKRVESIRKAFQIEAKTPPSKDSRKPEESVSDKN